MKIVLLLFSQFETLDAFGPAGSKGAILFVGVHRFGFAGPLRPAGRQTGHLQQKILCLGKKARRECMLAACGPLGGGWKVLYFFRYFRRDGHGVGVCGPALWTAAGSGHCKGYGIPVE